MALVTFVISKVLLICQLDTRITSLQAVLKVITEDTKELSN